MKEQKLNAYGMTPLTGKHYFVYGLGNFASQLSWTMVSTYLSIFYTDVFGLGVGAVALLMLIAKVWDPKLFLSGLTQTPVHKVRYAP